MGLLWFCIFLPLLFCPAFLDAGKTNWLESICGPALLIHIGFLRSATKCEKFQDFKIYLIILHFLQKWILRCSIQTDRILKSMKKIGQDQTRLRTTITSCSYSRLLFWTSSTSSTELAKPWVFPKNLLQFRQVLVQNPEFFGLCAWVFFENFTWVFFLDVPKKAWL